MPEELFTEGDVNFSEARRNWIEGREPQTQVLLQRDAEYFLHQSLSTPCLDVITSCEGIYLTNLEGKKYMDFHGNSVHQVGYRNQYVIDKVISQIQQMPFSPRRYTNLPAINLSEKLVSLMPRGLTRVLFTPGGTGAVGIALKLARVVTGKHKVVCFKDSFHGASLDAIAAGDEEQFRKYMGPLPLTSYSIPQPCVFRNVFADGKDLHYADALEELFRSDGSIGAFIAEPMRNTDVQIPSEEFWEKVRQLCTDYHVLLIADEIPIAFGRTGKMFAFEHYGIEPDIVCLGKGLGGGLFPMAAVVCREQFNIAGDVSLGHYTHEKSPLGSVAALATIEFIEKENLIEKVQADSEFMHLELHKLKKKHPMIGDVRGIGLLWGVELVRDVHTKEKASQEAEKVMYECLRQGLSFKVSQGNVLQLSPPLIISREELRLALDILDGALQRIA